MNPKYEDSKKVVKRLGQIVRSMRGNERNIQLDVLIPAVWHLKVHNNNTLLTKCVTEVPGSINEKKMVKWITANTGANWNVKSNKFANPAVGSDFWTEDFNEAKYSVEDNPWFAPLRRSDPSLFELVKMLQSATRKIENNEDEARKQAPKAVVEAMNLVNKLHEVGCSRGRKSA
jgi:hypothetical protein